MVSLQLGLCVYHDYLGTENIQTGNDSGLPAVGDCRLTAAFNKTLSLDFSESTLIRTTFRRHWMSEPLR